MKLPEMWGEDKPPVVSEVVDLIKFRTSRLSVAIRNGSATKAVILSQSLAPHRGWGTA